MSEKCEIRRLIWREFCRRTARVSGTNSKWLLDKVIGKKGKLRRFVNDALMMFELWSNNARYSFLSLFSVVYNMDNCDRKHDVFRRHYNTQNKMMWNNTRQHLSYSLFSVPSCISSLCISTATLPIRITIARLSVVSCSRAVVKIDLHLFNKRLFVHRSREP